MTTEPKSSLFGSVLGWLRAGYPNGVPREDYVALFAVLHRRLTEHEVASIAEELTADKDSPGTVDRAEIETAIADLAKEQPSDDDVARVAAALAAGGWPLTDEASDDPSAPETSDS